MQNDENSQPFAQLIEEEDEVQQLQLYDEQIYEKKFFKITNLQTQDYESLNLQNAVEQLNLDRSESLPIPNLKKNTDKRKYIKVGQRKDLKGYHDEGKIISVAKQSVEHE